MRMKLLCLLAFIGFVTACNGQSIKPVEVNDTKERTFKTITVPDTLRKPEERALYIAKHYWDTFDFTDTAFVHLPEVMEPAFVTYLEILKYVPEDMASVSIKEMMDKAEIDSTMFSYLAELYEKYLYDLESPQRNESMFIYALEAILDAPVWNEVQKVRPANLLELAVRNKVGEPATDFTYTLADGKERTLYQLGADRILLFFYDPDCHTCLETTDKLANSSLVKNAIQKNRLQILAVYPGEDLYAWKNHLSYIPNQWINAYDATGRIKNEEIYDLKASPTLYLLDKDKKVILKDATFEQIESLLQ